MCAEQGERLRTLDERHARSLGEQQMRDATALADARERAISEQQAPCPCPRTSPPSPAPEFLGALTPGPRVLKSPDLRPASS